MELVGRDIGWGEEWREDEWREDESEATSQTKVECSLWTRLNSRRADSTAPLTPLTASTLNASTLNASPNALAIL